MSTVQESLDELLKSHWIEKKKLQLELAEANAKLARVRIECARELLRMCNEYEFQDQEMIIPTKFMRELADKWEGK
jgi:hypothetical protein